MKTFIWMTSGANAPRSGRLVRKRLSRLACLGLLILLPACNSDKVESISGPTMGSTYRIQYVADNDTPAKSDLKAGAQDILDALNKAVSTYSKTSDIALFNAAPAGTCKSMPGTVFRLYDLAKMLNAQSKGAYDITLLPALSAWGFGPNGRVDNAPTQEQLNALRDITGMEHISTKSAPSELCKDSASSVEFNSIAAGYAVDEISALLESKGIESYLVEITGEVRAKGEKPDGNGWRIALEAPISTTRAAQRIVTLNGMSASTSGDYRNYYEENGVRYSHTLDPRTLSPVTHNLASVSVVAEKAIDADGYSTLLMVLGPEQGYDFAVQNHLSALFVISNGTGKSGGDGRSFTVRTTPEFEKRFPSLKGKSS